MGLKLDKTEPEYSREVWEKNLSCWDFRGLFSGLLSRKSPNLRSNKQFRALLSNKKQQQKCNFRTEEDLVLNQPVLR